MENCDMFNSKFTVDSLRKRLLEANVTYRVGKPIMTDEEFDAIEEKLRMINPNDVWFSKGVNDEMPKERAYELPFPMMSLDKVKTIETLLEWAKKFPNATYVITPKYDGLSVGMSSTNSWTRGDGNIGQECTLHVDTIFQKPEIEEGDTVRGEIIITNRDWKKFVKINEKAKSQRNSATGLINGDFDKDRIAEYSLLTIKPYEIMGSNMNKDKQLMALMEEDFVIINDINKLTEKYLLSLFMKWRKKFPIDGVVIDVNENEYRRGVEANGNPSYTVAYKHVSFSERKDGIIDHIERSINRNGVVTPVVVLKEPINISGADILKVSAINMRYVSDWALYPNTKVTIVRSGEVIPKIVSVENTDIPFREDFSDAKAYQAAYTHAMISRLVVTSKTKEYDYLFNQCPVCGGSLKPLKNDNGEWCELICENPECDGRMYSNISKFFEICGVKEFGKKTFEQLIDCGLVESSPFEVFNLTYNDLITLDGWAEVSVNKFLAEINRLRTDICQAKFCHATGWFSDLGEKTIQKIFDSGIEDFGDEELLKSIEGIQETTAKKFIKGLDIYSEHDEWIADNFKFTYCTTPTNEGKLNGLNVAMTGFRDKELAAEIVRLGGIVGDGVTKATNCLMVKDINSASSKVQKARKNGIEILDIDGFKAKYLAV